MSAFGRTISRTVVCLLWLTQAGSAEEIAVGKHHAWWKPHTDRGLLLVSLGGTNSRPTDFRAFDECAVELGYRALALDYPNQVISTACRESTQLHAFDHFRHEIATGEPVSEVVEVAQAQSLETQLAEALGRLGWSHIGWERTVIVGHSQGSGHAAYLGKRHRLRGVILLAGPQDTDARGPARWLSQPGQTPPDRYSALLHLDDYFDSRLQLRAVSSLRSEASTPVQLVYLNSECSAPVLISQEPAGDAHLDVMRPDYRPLWQHLLRRYL